MYAIPEKTWATLPLKDFRSRFFVEVFLESLHVDTPAFHRARLINSIASVEEVLMLLDDYSNDPKNLRNFINGLIELKNCISNDLILNKLFKRNILIIKSIIKQIINSEKTDILSLKKLKLLCKNILSCESEYFSEISKSLIYFVTDNEINLDHQDRITQKIYQFTSLFVSYLLHKNYSPKYLYNRSEMFTHVNNYKDKNFEEQLKYVVSKLNHRIDIYSVYFGVKVLSPSALISNFKDISFFQDVSDIFEPKEIQSLGPNCNLFICIKIQTTDYMSAAVQAEDKLDKILDILSFQSDLIEDNNLKTCLICFQIGGKNYKRALELHHLMNFLTSSEVKNKNFTAFIKYLFCSFETSSIEELQRSLHYLHFSKQTASIEQKLLNIWIALESLFIHRDSSNIIENILTYLPKTYAVRSIHERIKFILNLLCLYKIKIPSSLYSNTDFSILKGKRFFKKSFPLELFYKIFFNEKAMIEIFNSIDKKDYLKFRLMNTYKELSNAKLIKERIDKTTEDVTLQLRRIYLLRNKVAHQAFDENIKSQIVSHLYDYIFSYFHGLETVLQHLQKDRKISLHDAMLAYQMGTDVLYENLQKEDLTLNYETLAIIPII